MLIDLFIDYIICSGVFNLFLDGGADKQNQCVKLNGEFDQLFLFLVMIGIVEGGIYELE